MNELTTLQKRRKYEETMVQKYDSIKSTNIFVISMKWSREWTEFIFNGGKLPGEIDNKCLFDEEGNIKKRLESLRHYKSINKDVWDFLYAQYGGGPAIPRKTNDIYSEEAKSDENGESKEESKEESEKKEDDGNATNVV